jgi:hypothetical protein
VLGLPPLPHYRPSLEGAVDQLMETSW